MAAENHEFEVIIQNYPVTFSIGPGHQKSSHPDENLMFAVSYLNRCYRHEAPDDMIKALKLTGHITQLMTFLPYISEYYGINHKVLFDKWFEEYGQYYSRPEGSFFHLKGPSDERYRVLNNVAPLEMVSDLPRKE